jgi:hypothetical protein
MTFPSNSGDSHWSADRDRFEALLASLDVGESIKYATAEAIIGRDQAWLSQMFFHVKKRLAKNHKMVFGNIRTVGWQRLTDSDAVAHGKHDLAKARRHFGRARHRAEAVNVKNLTPELAQRHNLQASILATLHAMSRTRSAGSARSVKNAEPDAGTVKSEHFHFD